MASSSETLIVSAHYDDTYQDLVEKLGGGPIRRVSTAEGGHPSKAFVDAFRFGKRHHSYLFLQDSLDPQVQDVVAPFREMSNKKRAGVVAWGFFPMFFDTREQEGRVYGQYDHLPPFGIFGPIFFATHKAMERVAKLHLFPLTPRDKMDAQGTERAWAAAFFNAGIPMTALGPCITDGESPRLFPEDQTFKKVFAGRT